MPALDANIASIRERYDFRTYITTPAESEVFSALVNQTTFSYPLTSLTIDTNTGSTANVLEDMEVIVFDQSTTTVKGRLRIARGGTTSTVMQVNEFSAGRINIANNDKLSVRRSWRVRDRLVGATSTFPKDSRIAVSDNNSNPSPVANSGGHWAGFVDVGQTYATINFVGSTSFNIDPDTAGTITHSWTFPGGTPSSSTSADPSVQMPVGEAWVTHTVTALNGKTETQYVYVAVFNETTARPTDCLVDEMSASIVDGWRCRVTVPAGWTTTEAPDGALCIVWENETYGGTRVSYGAATTGRSHIKFSGFLVSDSVTRDYQSGTVSFDLINPLALLAQLPGFSQVLNIKNSPVNWRQVKGLTTNRAIVYLLRWGTTVLRTFDLILNGNDYNYPQLYVQAQTPDSQVREIVEGTASLLTCSRRGRLSTVVDLLQATSAQRTAATTTLSLTSADITEFDFERQHRYQYNTLEGRGFVAATTIKGIRPALSLAPGKAPAEAPQATTVERMIVDSASTLNTRTGYLYAKQNKLSNGLPTSAGSITLPGNFDVFDVAHGEWLKLTLASALHKRGIAFSSARFVTESISIEYDNENISKRVRLTIQEETDGVAGVTKNPPTQQKNNIPPAVVITPPALDFPYIIPTAPTGNAPGVATMQALLRSVTTRYSTTDLNAVSVAWTSAATSGLSGTVCDWVADPNNSNNVIVVTTTGAYTVSGIYSTPTVTLRHTFAATVTSVLYRVLIASRYTPGTFGVVSYYAASGGTTWTSSADYGVNWSENTISTHYNSTTSGQHGGNSRLSGWISEHTANVCFAGAYSSTAAGQLATSGLFVSTDGGVNWSLDTSAMTNFRQTGSGIHFPIQNNASDRYFYWTKCKTATTYMLMRTDRSTGTQTEMNPIPDGNDYGATWVTTSDIDRLSMVAVAYRAFGAQFGIGVAVSRDGGTSWATVVTPTNSIGDRYERAFFASNSRDVLYLVGEDGLFGLSADFGSTIQTKDIVGASGDVMRLVGV